MGEGSLWFHNLGPHLHLPRAAGTCLAFPRFYFVSSADLLDILSNGNDPVEVGGPLMVRRGTRPHVRVAPGCWRSVREVVHTRSRPGAGL